MDARTLAKSKYLSLTTFHTRSFSSSRPAIAPIGSRVARTAPYEPGPAGPSAPAVATGSRPYHVPLLRRAVRRVSEARSALPVAR